MVAVYDWQLATPAPSSSAASGGGAGTGTLPGAVRPRYAARGVLFPLRRDGKGDWANGTGEALAISKVELVIGTRPGEVTHDPYFGCRIGEARHKNNTTVRRALMRLSIIDAFVRYLPSMDLIAIEITQRARSGVSDVVIIFNERLGSGHRFQKNLEARFEVE